TPPRFSLAGQPDAKLACRHFGIRRSCFCRRKGGMTPSGCLLWKTRKPSRNGSGNLSIPGNWSGQYGRYGKRTPAIRRKKYGLSSCGSGRKPPYPPRPPWEGS
ncbi:MAG: hypothetical protein LBD29_11275, partial [Treponema sp.]|nr:hypothetical protein [Treponema sp.]